MDLDISLRFLKIIIIIWSLSWPSCKELMKNWYQKKPVYHSQMLGLQFNTKLPGTTWIDTTATLDEVVTLYE